MSKSFGLCCSLSTILDRSTHTTNVADRSKNYCELLIETRDYIDEHPNAYITYRTTGN